MVFSAKLSQRVINHSSSTAHIVLKNVYVDGVFFRNHAWTKDTKRLQVLSVGDNLIGTCKIKEYLGCDLKIKKGLATLRNIKKV